VNGYPPGSEDPARERIRWKNDSVHRARLDVDGELVIGAAQAACRPIAYQEAMQLLKQSLIPLHMRKQD
jgi:hypothetical protein